MYRKEYKYKFEQKIDDLEVAKYVWDAYSEGIQWKSDNVDVKVAAWKAAYDKIHDTPDQEGRSTFVDDTVRNYVNNVSTMMIEPLVNTNDLVRFTSNTSDENHISQAKLTEDLINYQITKKTDRFNLFDEAIKLFVGEGFVASKVYWDYRTKEILADFIEGFEDKASDKAEYTNLTLDEFEELVLLHRSKDETPVKESIKQKEENGEILVDVDFIYKDLISEKPNFENIPLENIVWSPNTTNITYSNYDCDYIIEHRVVSNSELRCMLESKEYGSLSKDEIDEILKQNSNDEMDTELSAYRDYIRDIDTSYNNLKTSINIDKDSQVVLEFHGLIDINKDGKDELVHLEVVGNKVIKIELNPYINNMIPYNVAVFDKFAFTVNGNSIPEFTKDIQKVRTSIIRSIQDNIAYSFNQNYIVEEGTLSPENRKRLMNPRPGDIITAKRNMQGRLSDKIMDIGSQRLPQDHLKVYEHMDRLAQENTGITAYTQGLDSTSLNNMIAIDTPIPMADGSVKLLEFIEDNDLIIGSNGKPTKVLKAHEIKPPVRAYEIEFESGEKIRAGEEHLWNIKKTSKNGKGYSKNWTTVDTDQIWEYYNEGRSIMIPKIERPEFENDVEVRITPYLLGAWLGDGNSGGSRITSEDYEIIEEFEKEYEISVDSYQNSGNALVYSISSKNKVRNEKGQFETDDSFHSKLRSYNLISRYGGEKHIPEEYFMLSYENRLELLRGLMDTDGCYHSNASVIFSQVDNQLLKDVTRLIKSLGYFPKVKLSRKAGEYEIMGRMCNCKDSYQIFFTALDNPFKLSRKANRWKKPNMKYWKNRIISMKEIPLEKMRCLTVDSEDKLFACGEFMTLTHNTATGVSIVTANSMKKMWKYTQTFIERFIKPTIQAYLIMNKMFLSETRFVNLVGNERNISKDDIDVDADISMSVSIKGMDDAKVQQMVQFMQMTQSYVQLGAMPIEALTSIIKSISEIWELNEVTNILKNSMEQAMNQPIDPMNGMNPMEMNGMNQPIDPMNGMNPMEMNGMNPMEMNRYPEELM